MTTNKGQAALLVLLGMAVVLSVVLSILASSTGDIRISSTENESLRAFSAAEAGIEKALVTNLSSTGTINNANFTADITTLAIGRTGYNYPSSLVSGDTGVIWLVSHINNDNLGCSGATSPCFTGHLINVCWGSSSGAANTSTTPAIEVTVFYLTTPGDYSTAKIAKGIYDPNSARLATNFYSATDPGTCTIDQTQYSFQKQIDLATLGVPAGSYQVGNGLQFISLRPLYNTAPEPVGVNFAFAGNTTIPSQGSVVDSVGTNNQATRKVEVTRNFKGVPPILDGAIFSQNGI